MSRTLGVRLADLVSTGTYYYRMLWLGILNDSDGASSMKNRSRLEIITTILEDASSWNTKSKIIQSARLSTPQVSEYLSFLLENDLMEYDNMKHLYKTTEKGFKLVRISREVSELFVTNVGKEVLVSLAS